ncbi:hypothetical protein QEG98_23400 [Myxococcus sp. MxC21-1]|uniref:hypothetical protein n=1 Tax=Myxococcus sp. MxC21-1 TaxID=3041439 RepID=UPI00292F4FD9|nr:hypothetical protein [Myxococcus sp. MxC21-1]WNZ59057.1 hypothetical protein QEG98_23400 [Myxococcus sp. MxC21-1]
MSAAMESSCGVAGGASFRGADACARERSGGGVRSGGGAGSGGAARGGVRLGGGRRSGGGVDRTMDALAGVSPPTSTRAGREADWKSGTRWPSAVRPST